MSGGAGGTPARGPAGQRPAPAGEQQPPVPKPSGAGAASLSYEQARDQLAELVRRLEAGGLTLEQSLELWERGEQLAAICEDWLAGARARLAAVIGEQQRSSGEEPF
jgi:exodeoxyribonuclease VII small subunit